MIYSGKLKRFGVYRNDTAPTTSLYVLFDNITPNGTVSAVPAGGFAYSQCVMIA